MIQTQIRHGGQHETTFFPAKPKLVRPAIVGTKEVAGETFYVGETGKLYRIALFDATFKVVEKQIKPKNTKGDNPNKKALK